MDLRTTYLGLSLRSPLVPSAAAPLTSTLDHLRRLEDAGAGAIVLQSLFEEQLVHDSFELHHHLSHGRDSYPEALTYFPEPDSFRLGPEHYLDHIRSAKAALSIPIIASLNGYSPGGWVEYARNIQDAGADAIELNLYFVPSDPDISGLDIEQSFLTTVRAVKAEVTIPVAVKISPYFSSLANMARRFDEAGADGLVLFNRFMQPDIDPIELDVRPVPYLSSANDLRLPMRWIALLYGRIDADLAATGGVQHGVDAVKLLMAGARITQVCSALLRHGLDHLRTLEQELVAWMETQEYSSVEELRGTMSQIHCPDPSAYERAQYLKTLQSYRVDAGHGLMLDPPLHSGLVS